MIAAPKLAVAYLRVSGHSQVDGDGFPRQRETIQRFADSNGYKLIGEYFEDVSGKVECEDRVDFARMLVDLEETPATVICERADRFARSMIAGEVSIELCRQRDIKVVGADTGMELTQTVDPMMDAFRQMQFLFAELDRKMLVAKLAAARARKRKTTGRCEGQKPYGSLKGEMVTRQLIIKLRDDGLGPEAIARRLNDRGVKTRTGREWRRGTVGGILKRESQ